MLKNRILSTLKFFDLQNLPLTLLELYRYLIVDENNLQSFTDRQGEIVGDIGTLPGRVALDEVLRCIEQDCKNEVQNHNGYYVLTGRTDLVVTRLHNYAFGIAREKLIRIYSPVLQFIPFVRGVALGGSQAMGLPKSSSDLDLFIVTDPNFLWLTRTLVTGYFQICGVRRYGDFIANRFCLNHYIAAPREVREYKNLYTAAEYAKLRPLAFASTVRRYQYNNIGWIRQLFPNVEFIKLPPDEQPILQKFFELLFDNFLGRWMEQKLKSLQLPRIRQTEKFIVVKDDELSFHPQSKQQQLLRQFSGQEPPAV